MIREDVFAYIKKEYDVEPDFPFGKDPETAVLRHKDTRKWFGLVMPIRANKLGYDSENWIDVVTMKSEPILIDSLVAQQGFHRAYHMNKTQWLTIELGSKVSDKEIRNLIDLSYDLTKKKDSKRTNERDSKRTNKRTSKETSKRTKKRSIKENL